MTTVTEGRHPGEFIVSESNGTHSREEITIASGQNLQAGHVLGKIVTATATGAAAAGNTGNGAIGSVSATSAAKEGIYLAVCIEPAANGGMFEVEGPDGVIVGTVGVGVAFNGPVHFTIADGATDFVAGDGFAIAVATTSVKYKEYNPANSDGSQMAVAILYAAVDATAGDAPGVGMVRALEYNAEEIDWFNGATAPQIAAGQGQLAVRGIIAR